MKVSMTRFAEQNGRTVKWSNLIGGMNGQRGTYTFASEEDAKIFADYARREDFPGLSEPHLLLARIPLPIARETAGKSVFSTMF